MAFRKITDCCHRAKITFWIRWIAVSSALGILGIPYSAAVAKPILVSAIGIETEPVLQRANLTEQAAGRSKPQLALADAAPSADASGDVSDSVETAIRANRPQSTGAAEGPSQPISKAEFLRQQSAHQQSAQSLLIPAATPDPSSILAQASTTQETESLRQRLIIDPLVELRPVAYTPGSSVGVPTAFGANYGDAFVGIAFSTRRPRVNEADGAITAGFGLGDSERAVGLEVSANIGSLRRFARNGDFGFKVHRSLPGRAAIAVGWDSGITWGEENQDTVSTIYGVASKVFNLQPANPESDFTLTASLGVGGGRFRSFDNIENRRGGVGVFGSLGLRVIPQASLIASWTGQDLNLGVSYLPIKTQPLFLTAVVGNVLSRNDNATLFSFGIGYGFNYAGYRY